MNNWAQMFVVYHWACWVIILADNRLKYFSYFFPEKMFWQQVEIFFLFFPRKYVLTKVEIFFLFFPRKYVLTFHENCLQGRQFSWNVKAYFQGKIWKVLSICHLLNLPRAFYILSVISQTLIANLHYRYSRMACWRTESRSLDGIFNPRHHGESPELWASTVYVGKDQDVGSSLLYSGWKQLWSSRSSHHHCNSGLL